MNKLVIAWMVENDQDVLPLSMQSVTGYADKYILINGNRNPRNVDYKIPEGMRNLEIINSPFPHNELGADGIQRNVYLKFLKEHHVGDWCLVLDADEVVQYPERLKMVIYEAEKNSADCINLRMRHLVADFGHEDSTKEIHHVPHRLFKISKDLFYPEKEHSVLSGFKLSAICIDVILWHINTARNVLRVAKKYDLNIEKSTIHAEPFLDWWIHSHALGKYPVTKVSPRDLPKILRDAARINLDWIYFQGRMMPEAKHFMDAIHWKDFFALSKNTKVLFVGCGAGHRMFAMHSLGMAVQGIELSSWVAKHTPHEVIKDRIIVDDILTISQPWNNIELISAYDVLEHLPPDMILGVLKKLNKWTAHDGHIIISVPFKGDPNLDNDPTHQVFWTDTEWKSMVIAAGYEIVPVPEHFLYKHQLIIGRKV